MGRNHRTRERPQGHRLIRSHLVADKELNAALSQPKPRAFGIRRRLEPASETLILSLLKELQREEDIPAKVELRDKLHVTLLSARAVGKQMMRGLVAGYELGKKGNAVKSHAQANGYFEPLNPPILRGDVRIYQGYSLFVSLESAEIADEIKDIHSVLGSQGIKGFVKDEQKLGLHISLGAAKQSARMSATEQRHVRHVIEDRFLEAGVPSEIPLLGWEVYP